MFPKTNINYNEIKKVDYKICVIKDTEDGDKFRMLRDEFGKLYEEKPLGDWTILADSEYKIEEVFKHKNTNTSYDFRGLVKKFLVNDSDTRVILSMNNKLVIEYFENEHLDVFVLKNRADSQRLNETIRDFTYANGLTNFIFFNDPTIDTIRPIYDALEERYGISREWMSRVSTR